MKLTPGEKLILIALADAADAKPGEGLDLGFIRNAILSGQSWSLSWELSGVPTEDTPEEVANETAEILSMWSVIERAVEALSPEAQEETKALAYPFDLKFTGFDANNDKHYGVASFLIKDMRRFTEFSERYLNSHTSSSLPHYRQMLPYYDGVMKAGGWNRAGPTADEIVQIVKAGWVDPSK